MKHTVVISNHTAPGLQAALSQENIEVIPEVKDVRQTTNVIKLRSGWMDSDDSWMYTEQTSSPKDFGEKKFTARHRKH